MMYNSLNIRSANMLEKQIPSDLVSPGLPEAIRSIVEEMITSDPKNKDNAYMFLDHCDKIVTFATYFAHNPTDLNAETWLKGIQDRLIILAALLGKTLRDVHYVPNRLESTWHHDALLRA